MSASEVATSPRLEDTKVKEEAKNPKWTSDPKASEAAIEGHSGSSDSYNNYARNLLLVHKWVVTNFMPRVLSKIGLGLGQEMGWSRKRVIKVVYVEVVIY